MSVKKSQRRKKNLYTEVDFENLIDAMMKHQVTIDSLMGNSISKEEMINGAYKMANREIGYRIEHLGE